MRTEHDNDQEESRDHDDHGQGHRHGDDHHPGHEGNDGSHPKTVIIYVNTRSHQVVKGELSYEEVVKLAFPSTPPGANVGYTVTWERGHGHKDGDLVAGQSVKVKEGMIFDVTATDLS